MPRHIPPSELSPAPPYATINALKTGTKRVCFLLRVKPHLLDEYRERHAHVWPEMLEALRQTGWTNYSLFLAPGGLLVGYLETQDFDAALRGMASKEINHRWQSTMSKFFEGGDTAAADEQMRPLEEVFHLD